MIIWLIYQYWIAMPHSLPEDDHYPWLNTSDYLVKVVIGGGIYPTKGFTVNDLFPDFFVLLLVALQLQHFQREAADVKKQKEVEEDPFQNYVNQSYIDARRSELKILIGEENLEHDHFYENIKYAIVMYSDKVFLIMMFAFGVATVDVMSFFT
eukprot:UN33793